jgi:transcriptional regulator with XRE-family HTH domain
MVMLASMFTKDALKAVREAAGESQGQMARRLGVERSRITQIEGGAGTFRPEMILKLCRTYSAELSALGLSHADFLRVIHE